jgi:hypothetical protein
MADCNYITPINSTDCISSSVPVLNSNFTNLQAGIDAATTLFNKLNNQFSSFTPGLTSLDQSILYFARFTEAYNPLTTSYTDLKFTGSIQLTRIFNTVDYNCNSKGERIQGPGANNGFYQLDKTTGIITIPPGIYDIDGEASGSKTETHVANLVYVDNITNTPADVIFYGSCEYTDSLNWWPITWSKVRGRAKFTNPNGTRIKMVWYPATDYGGVASKGRTFKDDGITTANAPGDFVTAVPLTYYSFINIQKIRNI